MMRSEPEPARRIVRAVAHAAGWAMAARWITAILGGYFATAGLATLLARLLPVTRVEATLWGMIAACPLFTLILLWSFREPRLGRIAGAVWGCALVAGVAVRALGVRP